MMHMPVISCKATEKQHFRIGKASKNQAISIYESAESFDHRIFQVGRDWRWGVCLVWPPTQSSENSVQGCIQLGCKNPRDRPFPSSWPLCGLTRVHWHPPGAMGNVASTHSQKCAKGRKRTPPFSRAVLLPTGVGGAAPLCCQDTLGVTLSSCPTNLQAFPAPPKSWGCFSAQGVLHPTSHRVPRSVCDARRARSLVDRWHLVQARDCTGSCPLCHHALSISSHRHGWAGLQVTLQRHWSPASCLSHRSGA